MDIVGILTNPVVLVLLVMSLPMGLLFYVMGSEFRMRLREGRKAKHRNFRLEVERIDLSQLSDKFKALNGDGEVDLEILRLKRALAILSMSQGPRKSKFKAILEFRGDTLVVTCTEGDLSGDLTAQWVVEALETEYSRRYDVDDMLQVVTVREKGKIAHTTVKDPEKFLAYVHLLHTVSYVEINRVASRELKVAQRAALKPMVGA